jgi:hypothetical protein
MALVTAGMSFSLRSAVLKNIQEVFFQPYHPVEASALVGDAAGAAFLGFAAAIFFGSPLCDYLGMRRLLTMSAIFLGGGTIATILVPPSASVHAILWATFFITGLGWGSVEAVINPLISTIYSDDKTHRLNVLHAWWPGGLIIGGLTAMALTAAGVDWKIKLGMVLVPAIATLVMLMGLKFPPTERVAAGVSASEMIKAALSPLFLLLMFCMLFTASSELAPGMWLDSMLSRLVGFNAILLLVYVSGLMFVMRHFAGSIAHKLSPIGLMFVSCALASVGLYLLGSATSAITGLLGATVWGVGVCYMWPTMLGITSERFPRGGALALGLMGCVGNLAINRMLPYLGGVFDTAKVQAAGGEAAFKAIAEGTPQMNQVLSEASKVAFHTVAIFPAGLLVVFGLWWLWDKSRGGYKAERLDQLEHIDSAPTPVNV